MRAVVGLGVGLLCAVLAAQVQAPPPSPPMPGQVAEKPPEQPPEKPPLQNTGKPMVVEFRCSEEDIQLAGLSCSPDDPCPLYLELSAVEAVGNRVFLAGNLHSSSTTLYSVLLASDDAGKTWREPYERIRAAGLDRIQFVDFESGWISGEVLSQRTRPPRSVPADYVGRRQIVALPAGFRRVAVRLYPSVLVQFANQRKPSDRPGRFG